jgi:hypothetical protein
MKRNMLIAGAASAALITSVAFAQAGGTGADGAAGTPTGTTMGERDTLNTPGSGQDGSMSSGSMSGTNGSGSMSGTSGSGMASGSGADMGGQSGGSYASGTSGSGGMTDSAMAAGERG